MSLRPLFAFAKDRRIELTPLLALADLAPNKLDDYDHRIPEAARAQIFIAAAERSRDPLFGPHVAEHAQMGVYDVLDYSLYFSSTLEQGLENIVRFHRVMCDAWALAIEHRAKTVRLRRIERTPGPECEAALATLLLRSRIMTRKEVTPIEVRFMHAAPSDSSVHEKWFGCPVRFGAPASELVLAAADLALPVPTANASVEKILGRYMTEILQRLPSPGGDRAPPPPLGPHLGADRAPAPRIAAHAPAQAWRARRELSRRSGERASRPGRAAPRRWSRIGHRNRVSARVLGRERVPAHVQTLDRGHAEERRREEAQDALSARGPTIVAVALA
jgi:hypothetical protein